MKLTHYITVVAGIAIGTSSCNYVTNPTPVVTSVNASCDTVFNVTATPPSMRNVLLEDFSGHKCPNCPDAGDEAENIHNSVGSRLVTVTIHPDPNIVTSMNSLVKESPAGSGSYETVWYIPEGGEIMDFFGDPGYIPVGLINRTMNGSWRYYDYTDWSNAVTAELAKPLDISLVNESTELTDGTVCGQAKVEFLNSVTGDIRLVHYLVEDSIPDYQLDGTTTIPNYMHRHVLRAVAGGNIWGESVASGSITSGTTYESFFSFDTGTYTVIDPHHLHVISYVYDDASKEVLQVVETHVD